MSVQRLFRTVMLISAAALFAGAVPATAARQDTSAADVSYRVAQAAAAIENYSIDRRQDAVDRAKAALVDLDARMDRLEARIERDSGRLDAAARARARHTLQSLQRQRRDVAEWYGGLKHSSSLAWAEVKDGFVGSYRALNESIAQAAGQF